MKMSFQRLCKGIENLSLIFLVHRENKYSVYTLLSSLEKHQLHGEISIYLARVNSPETLLQDQAVHQMLSEVRGAAEKYGKVILAISLMTTSLYEHLHLISRLGELKQKLGNLALIAGGPHASGDPLGTLKLGFNAVFIGEAEESFPSFLREYAAGGEPASVDGVALLEDEKLKIKPPRRISRLDDYPAFPSIARGFKAIEITRGCPYGCGFCQVSSMFGREMRHRSVENVVEHVELMLRHGRRDVRFVTPNCLCYGARNPGELRLDVIEELLEQLHQLASRHGGRIFFGSFPSEMRPEYVTEEAARILAEYSASRSFVVGAQSGSDRVLEKMHRGHTTEDVINAVKTLLRRGREVAVDFIFGLPYEEEEDAEATANLMEKLARMGASIHAHYFIPLPGTAMSNLEPKPIHPKILKTFSKLIGVGKAYGHWKRQITIAQKILEMKKLGIIHAQCAKLNI